MALAPHWPPHWVSHWTPHWAHHYDPHWPPHCPLTGSLTGPFNVPLTGPLTESLTGPLTSPSFNHGGPWPRLSVRCTLAMGTWIGSSLVWDWCSPGPSCSGGQALSIIPEASTPSFGFAWVMRSTAREPGQWKTPEQLLLFWLTYFVVVVSVINRLKPPLELPETFGFHLGNSLGEKALVAESWLVLRRQLRPRIFTPLWHLAGNHGHWK